MYESGWFMRFCLICKLLITTVYQKEVSLRSNDRWPVNYSTVDWASRSVVAVVETSKITSFAYNDGDSFADRQIEFLFTQVKGWSAAFSRSGCAGSNSSVKCCSKTKAFVHEKLRLNFSWHPRGLRWPRSNVSYFYRKNGTYFTRWPLPI